jgi:hypothetical protein
LDPLVAGVHPGLLHLDRRTQVVGPNHGAAQDQHGQGRGQPNQPAGPAGAAVRTRDFFIRVPAITFFAAFLAASTRFAARSFADERAADFLPARVPASRRFFTEAEMSFFRLSAAVMRSTSSAFVMRLVALRLFDRASSRSSSFVSLFNSWGVISIAPWFLPLCSNIRHMESNFKASNAIGLNVLEKKADLWYKYGGG